MKAIGLLAAVLLSMAVAFGQESSPDKNWAKIAALSARRTPVTNVVVVSGTEIEIEGIRCRLFGIRTYDEATSQAKAKRFLELYVKDYGGYFSIYNDNSPINDKDGTPLIWLKGHGNGGWAQETLVQAGLAKQHYTDFHEYRFKTPVKTGWEYFDWKKCLVDAELHLRLGKKVNVNFTWPEPATNKKS